MTTLAVSHCDLPGDLVFNLLVNLRLNMLSLHTMVETGSPQANSHEKIVNLVWMTTWRKRLLNSVLITGVDLWNHGAYPSLKSKPSLVKAAMPDASCIFLQAAVLQRYKHSPTSLKW